MVDESILKLWFLAASFLVVFIFASWYRRDPLLEVIPTVGFSDPILSYFSALRSSLVAFPDLNMGRGLFKTATFRRWLVLASGPELIEDLRKAPDDVLSLMAPLIEIEYTVDLLELDNEYHADVIRSKLTRNINLKDVRDEFIRSLDASIPLHGDDWVKVPVIETILRVVSATTNRLFVGLPLCRNQDYLILNLNFTANLVKIATIIGMFPKPLKPIAARLLSNLPSQIRQEMEFIRPMVEERFARMDEFGEDWDDKPMFTNVLYRLLSIPEYVEPLRHDVETAVAEEGWAKAGLDKMHKIDSFLRETQRFDSLVTMLRLALRPFTFSNGVTVPAGTLIAAPTGAIHRDEDIYPDPEEFDGSRFVKLRKQDEGAMGGRQAFSLSHNNLTFGYGRHACPGRFFAVNEVKTFLAHVVVTYDVKFEEGKQAPRSLHIGSYLKASCIMFHRLFTLSKLRGKPSFDLSCTLAQRSTPKSSKEDSSSSPAAAINLNGHVVKVIYIENTNLTR
ncbi:cytochrome P450 [Lactarius indigo]|nr:cytochrome P450 [Lactarius indigo]